MTAVATLEGVDFDSIELATALLARTGENEWRIVSQNKMAALLWGDYDFSEDMALRLSLLEAIKKPIPSSFVHKISVSIQSFRFITTPHSAGLLVQFFQDVPEHTSQGESLFDLYETVLNVSHNGLFDFNLQNETIRYSRSVHEVCGVSVSGLGNHKTGFFKRIHPNDVPLVEEALEMHLQTAWPFDVRFRFKTDAGTYVWLQSYGKALKNKATGQLERFVGSLTNISQRKYVEDMVHQREQLVEQIIDSLPISIYVKDDTGCFRFFSRQTEKETGIDRAGAIGKTDYEIFPIQQARLAVQQDQAVIREGRLILSEEARTLPTGETRWVMQGKGPIQIRQEDSTKIWLIGFSLDITERKRAEDMQRDAKIAAEEAVKAKSDFLSVMSHEIRTPLNSVIGTAQLLQDLILEEEPRHYIDMIRHSGEHLLQLINDILDFNKLEADKIELEAAPFDLMDLVKGVVNMNQLAAEKKNLALSVEWADDLPAYYLGDVARLRQILLNLVGNALKFTLKGQVSLRVRPLSPQGIRFDVSDTGIGIRSEQVDKLFSVFTQADASTTRQFGGTGLGLSISKKLVEIMGGRIGVDSVYGEGSTFWFELPLAVTEAPEKVSEPLILNEALDPLNLLVAEDNLPNQLLIKAILTKQGHKVTLVENGREAVQAIEAKDAMFDLVLMDMQMPEMDGLTATQKIRASNSHLAKVPIIALTANALSGDREKVMSAGMNDYLTKPIDMVQLKRLLMIWGACKAGVELD
ncbi:MAG: ATP-binding protein [Hydrogenovibrio sp.]